MKMIFRILFIFLSLIPMAALADNDILQAQQVIEKWFDAMHAKNITMAESFMLPQYQSMHLDGVPGTRVLSSSYLRALSKYKVELSDFRVTQSGNVIVATYTVNKAPADDKQKGKEIESSRLTVLQKTGKKWYIVAHANMEPANNA